MKKIGVLNKYDIMVERGIMGACGEKIREISNADVAAVVSDDNVAPIYLDSVTKSLQSAGFTVIPLYSRTARRIKTSKLL